MKIDGPDDGPVTDLGGAFHGALANSVRESSSAEWIWTRCARGFVAQSPAGI